MSRYAAKELKEPCGVTQVRRMRRDEDRPFEPLRDEGDLAQPPTDYPKDADKNSDRQGESNWCIDKG